MESTLLLQNTDKWVREQGNAIADDLKRQNQRDQMTDC
jgi:hypothetical protein